MGASNYNQMDQYIAECADEDKQDLINYENKVMKEQQGEGEQFEPQELQEKFNLVDFTRGYVAEKFCVFQVYREKTFLA